MTWIVTVSENFYSCDQSDRCPPVPIYSVEDHSENEGEVLERRELWFPFGGLPHFIPEAQVLDNRGSGMIS